MALGIGGIQEDARAHLRIERLACFPDRRGDLVNRPDIETARQNRNQECFADGERSAQAAGIPASNIDDDIVVLRSELADLRPDRATLQTHCRIARLTQLDAAKLREVIAVCCVPVNQEDVTTGRSPDDGGIDGDGCLAYARP